MPQKYEREIEELLNGLDDFLPEEPKSQRVEKPERERVEKVERLERERLELLEFRPRRTVQLPVPTLPARKIKVSIFPLLNRFSTRGVWITIIVGVIFLSWFDYMIPPMVGASTLIFGIRLTLTLILIAIYAFGIYLGWRDRYIHRSNNPANDVLWRGRTLNRHYDTASFSSERLRAWWRKFLDRGPR